MKMRVLLLPAIVVALVVNIVSADVVRAKLNSVGGVGVSVRADGVGGVNPDTTPKWHSTTAGRFNMTPDYSQSTGSGDALTNPFYTFCVDLKDTISTGSWYKWDVGLVKDSPVNAGADPWIMGSTKAARLMELWAQNYAADVSPTVNKSWDFDGPGGAAPVSFTQNERAAAFQLAVWEIVYTNPAGAYDVNNGWTSTAANGGFEVNLLDSHKLVKLSNLWLSTIDGVGTLAELRALYSPRSTGTDPVTQDLLVQIPAPGAALLGFIGFGFVGWLKRRFA